MEIVRPEHVARLFRDADGANDAVLILIDGRADVVAEAALDDPRYASAVRLVGLRDLGSDHGGTPSDDAIAAMAERLNEAAEHLEP
ncbi:hypothetical protein ACFO4E_15885 [Nocardiopsis mangrovi]|uniref:Uncharacterized protein n=1 Tax=Nocardiopsis mangrovi TaxID=1179818 RepID=A0ABV9DZK0_9ACTN